MLIFHYKHTRIPMGNITILWLNMVYAYFSLQTHKDTPGKYYNSLVKYVLCLYFIINTQVNHRETLQFFSKICFTLIFHYKHKRIPQGNITILWLNRFYAYFSLQTQKDTPGKHYNYLVKYVLRLPIITNTKGYPRETLQFFG